MTASRRQALGLAAAAALALTTAQGAQAADAALAKAVASETRPAADRARDKFRNPAESLSFWGLKPGQTVVEVSPGGQLIVFAGDEHLAAPVRSVIEHHSKAS